MERTIRLIDMDREPYYEYKYDKNKDLTEVANEVCKDIFETVKRYTKDSIFKELTSNDKNNLMVPKFTTTIDCYIQSRKESSPFTYISNICAVYKLVARDDIREMLEKDAEMKSFIGYVDTIPMVWNSSLVSIYETAENIVFSWDGIHNRVRPVWGMLDFKERIFSGLKETEVLIDPFYVAI